MKKRCTGFVMLTLALGIAACIFFPTEVVGFAQFGNLVQIRELNFIPDALTFPAGTISVLVVQNREDFITQHEVWSRELFEPGTLVSISGSGTIEYGYKTINRVLLDPGQEVVIWFYVEKDRIYNFHCNLNGHAMHAVINGS